MDATKTRPLETLDFRFRPLAPHAVAWSCDAELAIALDDAIHVFIPEFPSAKRGDEEVEDESMQPQFSSVLEISGMFRPEPPINTRLCADAGVELPAIPPDGFVFRGVGRGPITGDGAGLGQTVRLEWSPTGLGQNLRPVLSALATNGSLVTLGEHIDSASIIATSVMARSFNNWRVLWGLGALLPLPDDTQPDGYREMEDKIVAFSWAKEILPGRALLAYKNDAGEIVIFAVQHFPRDQAHETSGSRDSMWKMSELARFDGQGPHTILDPHDPESAAYGSAFGLKWSSWHVSPLSRTATLAYVANNYIGFRRITITGDWHTGHDPTLHVEQSDTTGICMSLGPDAFVVWEDAIWPEGDLSQMARGIIATPLIPKPFQVDLCGGLREPLAPHSTLQCATTYPPDEEVSTNPITGLIVHPPVPDDVKPPVPRYSVVRLSATAANRDWYQTNAPETDAPLPQWAEYVLAQAGRRVPRVAALHGVDSDSDSDALEDEYALETGPMARVHPHRLRFWGLAASPGGGCTAALVTKYNTQHPHRRPRSKLLFGLTTEGRLWEAVYGGQGRVSDVIPSLGSDTAAASPSPLRDRFQHVIPSQRCVFCDAPMVILAHEATCENGHSFATCTASGLAIMAPGVSRLCAVCGLRCLEAAELAALAKQHLGADAVVDSTQVCGNCGGKFVT
ncbi:hypothetical protein HIM_01415 [Hirsutella minnesotensis 3608]|nr:hypothetical protein HIM_01415 [Hirsutella minnesotensis 3608]